MACFMNLRPNQTFQERSKEVDEALKRLEAALRAGTVRVKIAPNGAMAFDGWTDRVDLTDVCAFRSLSTTNSQDLRNAVAQAERQYGRRVDLNAVRAGWHSHGGNNWEKH